MVNSIHLRNNKFVKVSSANGAISFFKAILKILSNKVIAIIVGTSGVAMIGQLQSFISIVTQISNGGFDRGLTKYIAENRADKKLVMEFIGTAFTISFTLTSVTTILILLFSKTITFRIFNTTVYTSIIIVFAVTLVLYNLLNLILNVVNGFQSYRQYFKINLATTFVGFIVTVILVVLFKEYGALLAIVISQSLISLIAFFYIRKDFWVKAISFHFFKKDKLRLLFKYSIITIFASIAWPIAMLIIRTYVINNISSKEAGLWQAISYINDYIVGIATGSFSVYLLPRLSSLKENNLLKNELINTYKIIIPVTTIGFILIYILRGLIIKVLYSKEFLEAGKYLLLQMVGSFFWMCKSPFMNFMFAKEMLKTFFITELTFAFTYALLTFILISRFQVQGIQISYAITMFCYFVVSLFLIRKYLNRKIT